MLLHAESNSHEMRWGRDCNTCLIPSGEKFWFRISKESTYVGSYKRKSSQPKTLKHFIRQPTEIRTQIPKALAERLPSDPSFLHCLLSKQLHNAEQHIINIGSNRKDGSEPEFQQR